MIRVEVWVACDTCDLEIGPTLTETTARNIARAARWVPFTTGAGYGYDNNVETWHCPKCLGRTPLV